MNTIINAMTVDVEDYFHVSAFDNIIPTSQWSKLPLRVEKKTYEILDLFSKHNIQATFFVLGWVAKQCPNLIKEIYSQGHEIACHGFMHKRVYHQTQQQFFEDVNKSKQILEDITGVNLKGYRAPSYSINSNTMWALEVLEELGFVYSSSIYPVKHDIYGSPKAPRFKYTSTPKGLIELPISTIRLANRNIPCGGGGFFRLYPYSVSKWAINHLNQKEQKQYIFYFHPWEIDPNQPRQENLNLKTRFRHYYNLTSMKQKITNLLQDFKWGTMENVFIPKHS